ncbi:putative mitochondrion protein [Cutaneotrichosporon oleaginosum]|uniref:Putative mitochondrion protein n=1 Tax=Cutaneotrichosporon oleaginosum TaxID=879819 RepID=A0A0J1B274_9TREE|nr:putative mitochondrion protein [Cutaneotrichosporon oleaginosum]KLT41719.1 putative mitochondrion protein [Cutaneotrichosporon oleaginosum]TXT08091.1 hypothetical protein COLE_05015 [Cutaneotrichosporon oleaginosum]
MSDSSDTKYLDSSNKAYLNHVVKQATKGAALGALAFIPTNWALARRYPVYRNLPLPGKAFLAMMMVVPVGTVFAEKAGEHYIAETQWRGVAWDELSREKQEAEARWAAMSTGEKIKDFANRHQYGIIGGSWVASLGIAFGIVARNKYQTFPQKLVQARMYAQGLTVGVLIASAVMAGVNAQGKKPVQPADHSWRDMLEQGGNLTKAERIALHTVRKVPVDAPAPAPATV